MLFSLDVDYNLRPQSISPVTISIYALNLKNSIKFHWCHMRIIGKLYIMLKFQPINSVNELASYD